jgi:purine nucleosidase
MIGSMRVRGLFTVGAVTLGLLGCVLTCVRTAPAQAARAGEPQLVWVDTDIGDDIDDAFALGLILRSPELKVLGISTAFGDTELRARLVDRMLASNGVRGVSVTAGVLTRTDNPLTQRAYAERYPERKHVDGVAAMLTVANAHPGQVTLIALGPLMNVGAAIGRDPEGFKKFKRIVMMGGSIERGYDGPALNGNAGERRPADAEWNINRDPKDAATMFAAGVPIFMMPLDSTQIRMKPQAQDALFATGNPVTDQLTLLYHQWIAGPVAEGKPTPVPTLFDPVAVAYTFRPELCPATPMHIEVDDKGFTRKADGKPNAEVCLKSDETGFLSLLLGRLQAAK